MGDRAVGTDLGRAVGCDVPGATTAAVRGAASPGGIHTQMSPSSRLSCVALGTATPPAGTFWPARPFLGSTYGRSATVGSRGLAGQPERGPGRDERPARVGIGTRPRPWWASSAAGAVVGAGPSPPWSVAAAGQPMPTMQSTACPTLALRSFGVPAWKIATRIAPIRSSAAHVLGGGLTGLGTGSRHASAVLVPGRRPVDEAPWPHLAVGPAGHRSRSAPPPTASGGALEQLAARGRLALSRGDLVLAAPVSTP